MNYQNPFQEAHKVPLNDFFQRETGLRPTRKTAEGFAYNYCPSCGQSEKTSDKFSIFKNTTFRCFSCEANGDIVDLAVILWGCTKIEAARRISGIEDIPTTHPHALAEDQEQRELKAKSLHQVLMILGQIALDWAMKGDTRPHLSYLASRGFSQTIVEEALRRQLFGLLPVDSKDLTQLLSQEIGRPLLEKAGIWKPDKKMPGIIFRPLVLFLPGMQSAEFSLIRKPEGNQSKRIRYGSTDYPYFWKGTANTQVVGITEGFFDLLALADLDPKNDILGIPGTGTWTDATFLSYGRQFTPHKTFHIWLDGDPAGLSGTKAIQDTLTRLGYPSTPHYLPDGMDVNDHLLSIRRQAA